MRHETSHRGIVDGLQRRSAIPSRLPGCASADQPASALAHVSHVVGPPWNVILPLPQGHRSAPERHHRTPAVCRVRRHRCNISGARVTFAGAPLSHILHVRSGRSLCTQTRQHRRNSGHKHCPNGKPNGHLSPALAPGLGFMREDREDRSDSPAARAPHVGESRVDERE
jgi:hypothetical protein